MSRSNLRCTNGFQRIGLRSQGKNNFALRPHRCSNRRASWPRQRVLLSINLTSQRRLDQSHGDVVRALIGRVALFERPRRCWREHRTRFRSHTDPGCSPLVVFLRRPSGAMAAPIQFDRVETTAPGGNRQVQSACVIRGKVTGIVCCLRGYPNAGTIAG
jgi:hypothetical protein